MPKEKGEVKKLAGFLNFMSRKRLLVLTDKPRLLYLDPATAELETKGSFALSSNTVVTLKGDKTFTVNDGTKERIMESPEAQTWVKLIKEACK